MALVQEVLVQEPALVVLDSEEPGQEPALAGIFQEVPGLEVPVREELD